MVLGGLLLSAGCLGGDDGDATNATDPEVEPSDAAGQAPADAAAPTAVWQEDDRTGTVNGIGVAPIGAAFEGIIEDVDVAEGTLVLSLNVTTTGGELLVELHEPCDAPDPVAGCPVVANADTSGGVGSVTIDGPPAGTWQIGLFCNSVGPCTVEYLALIALKVPV